MVTRLYLSLLDVDASGRALTYAFLANRDIMMRKNAWLVALIIGTLVFGTAHGAVGNRHMLASASASTSAQSHSDSPTADASASASAFSEGGVASAHAYASTEVRQPAMG